MKQVQAKMAAAKAASKMTAKMMAAKVAAKTGARPHGHPFALSLIVTIDDVEPFMNEVSNSNCLLSRVLSGHGTIRSPTCADI